MTEPTITCPGCKAEIKLTESLAAPVLESARRDFELRLAQKDADFQKKDVQLREREAALARDREAIDGEVAAKLAQERTRIAADEAKKARLAMATDLEQKAGEIAELQNVLRLRDAKLAEAQQVQADLLKKQRELDDARRELELTVEKRVQAGLDEVHIKARQEAEEGLKLKVMEKEQTILSMQKQIERVMQSTVGMYGDLQGIAEKTRQEIEGLSSRGKQGFTPMPSLVTQVVERIETLYARDSQSDVTGIATGFTDLDKMTSGLQPGDLVIVAGRPSMGKTAFSINIAENVALDSKLPVAIFSMEMGATQLAMRMLGSVGKLNQHELRTGSLQDDDWGRLVHALGKLNDAPIHIDESTTLSAIEVCERARHLYHQNDGLGLIVVDCLQLMSVNAGKASENHATEISEISRSLKSLARELHVPVIALSQLNSSLEYRSSKRPVMSDLRESGAIEQNADLILFIYRDEVYNPDSPDKGKAEIIISKHRNGPIGRIDLAFCGEYKRFDNLTSGGH